MLCRCSVPNGEKRHKVKEVERMDGSCWFELSVARKVWQAKFEQMEDGTKDRSMPPVSSSACLARGWGGKKHERILVCGACGAWCLCCVVVCLAL